MNFHKIYENFIKTMNEMEEPEIDEHFLEIIADLIKESGFDFEGEESVQTLERRIFFGKPLIVGNQEIGRSGVRIFFYTKDPKRSFNVLTQTVKNGEPKEEIFYERDEFKIFKTAEQFIQRVKITLQQNEQAIQQFLGEIQ